MIILSNVKITNNRLLNLYRGSLKLHDRMDVFKYQLASLIPLDQLVSKYIFYIDLATTEYAGEEYNLEKYIRSIFPEEKLILNFFRNTTQADWKKTCDYLIDIDDNVILNLSNDDHIFLDSNIEMMEKSITMLSNHKDYRTQIGYSHWPECMRRELLGDNCNDYFQFAKYRSIESIDILRKERWLSYWLTQDLGDDNDYYRPELLYYRTKLYENGNTIIFPLKEQFRHFDGYGHIAYNDPDIELDVHNTAPPLEIPLGFFEKKIQIAYGYNEYRPNWVNINPANKHFKVSFESGTDYKFVLEDIPLFWKPYISMIDVNPLADLEFLKECRDEHMYNTANTFFPHSNKEFCDRRLFKKFYLSEKYKNI